nr:hypothetical protein Iba_chr15aCG4670 [Ipomoea batatas]
MRVAPRISLLGLAPLVFLLLSALGLLPALLTPVGDEAGLGLPFPFHPSVIRLRAEGFLHSPVMLLVPCKTSPRGPPMEDSHGIGIQFPCLWFCSLMTAPTPNLIWVASISRDSFSGQVLSFSFAGDIEDVNSEVAIGIDIES